MSIPIDNFKLPAIITGFPNNYPDIRPMVVADNLTAVTTPGYLNNAVLGGQAVSPFSLLPILYNYTEGQSSYTMGWFQVSITMGIITLFEQNSSHGATVTLPTVANTIATFTNTTGNLGEPGSNVSNPNGNITAGSLTTSGSFVANPVGPNLGSFTFQAANQTGNFQSYFNNAAFGQATIITVPDPGATTANVLLNKGVTQMAAASSIVLAKSNGTESGTGSSGTVTTTAQAGQITSISLTTAAGGQHTILWTNSLLTSTSAPQVTLIGATNGATNSNISIACSPGGGAADIVITNNNPSAALNGIVTLSYAIF